MWCVACGTILPKPHICNIKTLLLIMQEKLVIMSLYRSPLTVVFWQSSFLKIFGPMILPAMYTKRRLFLDVLRFRPWLVNHRRYKCSNSVYRHCHLTKSMFRYWSKFLNQMYGTKDDPVASISLQVKSCKPRSLRKNDHKWDIYKFNC